MVASLSSLSIEQRKAALRRVAKQQRSVPSPSETRGLIRHLSFLIQRLRPQIIAAVWPLPQEIDLRPFCTVLHRAGYGVVLPETPPKGEGLVFRRWTPETKLKAGRFGTQYPSGVRQEPDVILVPLLAFDRRGGRLGYGGGYYDRTLSLRPQVQAVGYALAQQEQEDVPMDNYDQYLSYIVTEKEIIHTRPPKE